MGIEDRLRALTRLLRDESAFEDHMAALRRIEEDDMNRIVGAAIVAASVDHAGNQTDVERMVTAIITAVCAARRTP